MSWEETYNVVHLMCPKNTLASKWLVLNATREYFKRITWIEESPHYIKKDYINDLLSKLLEKLLEEGRIKLLVYRR
jgi:hypothetical protein